jgi:hypothetical protein
LKCLGMNKNKRDVNQLRFRIINFIWLRKFLVTVS